LRKTFCGACGLYLGGRHGRHGSRLFPACIGVLQHLKTSAEFATVFDQGRAHNRSPHFVLYFLATPAAKPELRVCVGVITPKRWAKRAVTRNTLKRQIYAICRDVQPQLAAGVYVVRLRAEFSRQNFPSATSNALKKAARTELQTLFAKALI
jgi:ribonuclease P protein component